MPRVALLTGSPGRLTEVGPSLAGAGYALTVIDDPARLEEVCATLPPGSIDCYVQLPDEPMTDPTSGATSTGISVARSSRDRLERVAAVLPWLRAGGCAVLVEATAGDTGAPDERIGGPAPAVRSGPRASVRKGSGPEAERGQQADARLVMLCEPCSTEAILHALHVSRRRPVAEPVSAREALELSPDVPYSRWKEEILSTSRYLWL